MIYKQNIDHNIVREREWAVNHLPFLIIPIPNQRQYLNYKTKLTLCSISQTIQLFQRKDGCPSKLRQSGIVQPNLNKKSTILAGKDTRIKDRFFFFFCKPKQQKRNIMFNINVLASRHVFKAEERVTSIF